MWGKAIKFASRLEFHSIGFRDEIGEPCRCFLKSANRNKRKENEEKKEKKRKKRKEASVADFVICLLAYESGFFFNFCLPDHLLEGRKEN